MVPVMLLIAATGIAFGPLLGPVYAMAGCLASASTGFAIGRWMGRRRVEQLGGERITRITHALKRNGTLAVFLAPQSAGAVHARQHRRRRVDASAIRDFLVGTVLGMTRDRRRARRIRLSADARACAIRRRDALAIAALFVGVPLTVAWLINRALRRARPAG